MKKLIKLYYKYFKTYRVLETRFVTYKEASIIIGQSPLIEPESEKWVLAKEEDSNPIIGWVYLCRKERIIE